VIRDLVVPVGIIGILVSMVVPLSTGVLDLLLVVNLLGALLLLLMTISVSEPLKLSALPTILLLATLFRLALNISTTRLILGDGDAGAVVTAFGHTVIQGNIIVGAVIFLVLTLIQFIVIAKGSERVAEVSARFTLDALPGRQMSIDADVRAGLLDTEGARLKRQELQIESRFYGALDGAMKFIKGDAIAGLFITAINVVGGFIIGVTARGLSLGESVTTYTVLTVGDGLLAQIPALLNALAAGLVVTRVTRGDGAPLARELLQQLGQLRGVKFILAVFTAMMAAVPGMPATPFVISAVVLTLTGIASRKESGGEPEETIQTYAPRLPPLWEIRLPGGAEFGACRGKLDQSRQHVYDEMGLLFIAPEITTSAEPEWSIHFRGLQVEGGGDPEALFSNFEAALRRYAVESIDDIFTRRLLDFLDRDAPELVSNVVPTVATVTQLTELLRELVREGVSIRNFDLIVQAVAESAGSSGGSRGMLQDVRIALRRIISAQHIAKDRTLHAVTVDPLFDLAFTRVESERAPLDLDLLERLADEVKRAKDAVVVTSKGARATVRDCLRAKGIGTSVLAYEELVDDVRVVSIGHVTVGDESAAGRVIDALAA
jgi:type III secretion protein V